MRISDVLADKRADKRTGKATHVITVWPDTRLSLVTRLLDDHNIASVVVVDHSGRPKGIVTERELVRTWARLGAAALNLTAGQAMLSPAPACSPDDTIGEVLRLMTDYRVRHVVVMRAGIMVGIVSIGDLVKIRLTDAELENRVLREMALARLVT
ncbi:MAG TPA: CBS domain-containing protein [Hyphomicrobiaceae bacterium]|nr:CBS domain-containing protein [Hyphomicrobiaceae bacterium]